MSELPMTPGLDKAVHETFVDAFEWRYPTVTVEHLLYHLLDDELVKVSLLPHLRNMELLRAPLLDRVKSTIVPVAESVEFSGAAATLEFELALTRGKEVCRQASATKMNSLHVVIGIFADRTWRASQYLQVQGMTRKIMFSFLTTQNGS